MMENAADFCSRRPTTGVGSIATSLFGGAMLATIANASFAQVTYLADAPSLAATTVSSGYVVLAGNTAAGDGGGGTFLPGLTGTATGTCTPDNGTVFQDNATPTHH